MLFSIIRNNKKLATKRNPAFDTNRFAKFLIYFMVAYWAAFLLFMGVILPAAFEEISPAMEPYHLLNQGLIYILLADFVLRFTLQPPMSSELKPYLLLPVKKNKLINIFLLQNGLSGYNFFWFFFFIPFAFLTIVKFYGFGGLCLYSIGIWLLIVMNSYWHALCKMLYNEHQVLIVVPILFYACCGWAEFWLPHRVSTFTMNLGEGFMQGNVSCFLLIILVILFLFWLNGTLQLHFLFDELAKVRDTKLNHVSEYKFLDRYGLVGEYMRLELKLYMRNKTAKKQFISAFIVMLLFSCAMAFSDIYDGAAWSSYISIYTFCVLGIMTLGQVMCFEGNYIDGLMSRKESIYTLLRAKYYINCLFVLIPFFVMLAPVVRHKMNLLAPISYSFFTVGFIFALLLQLAVYNTRTMPLNATIMQSNKTNTSIQMIITLLAFTLPFVFDMIFTQIAGRNTTSIIECAIGILFVITHRFWLKNIYKRLMKRKYQNMEGFRATR
ncbi:DUF5687 family protein [Phocaeicola abscessus]|uniref:DUF5687 family protein n=1 Tax=Phocaeicola abscessus TaxID=555313 RepID=UPI0003855FE3|nr:DUF5687 family protein [Phocaeicola abscessus]EPT34237.1 putative membrane protein [Bacteroidetes bacterium oral taxon 272 str. F0290]